MATNIPSLPILDAISYMMTVHKEVYVSSIGKASLSYMYWIADMEAQGNHHRYHDFKIRGNRTRGHHEKVFYLRAGKLVEIEVLRQFECKGCLIIRGVRFFGDKPDDGVDLKAKGISNTTCDNTQCKYWGKVHVIKDLEEFKKDFQGTRLVCGFSESFDNDFRPPHMHSINWSPAPVGLYSYGDWNLYELSVDAIYQDKMTKLHIDSKHANNPNYPYVRWFEP